MVFIPNISFGLSQKLVIAAQFTKTADETIENNIDDPVLAKNELESFLDSPLLNGHDQIKTVIIETPYGEIRFEAEKYEYGTGQVTKRVQITVHPLSYYSPRVHFILDGRNQPINIQYSEESAALFAGLFQHAQCHYLAQLFGQQDAVAFEQQTREQNLLEKAISFLDQATNDESRTISPSRYTGEEGMFIHEQKYEIKPLDTPLSTRKMIECTTLVVIDGNQHYMAHIDWAVSKDTILQSLDDFDLPNCQIYIMAGAQASISVQTIVSALIEKGAEGNIKFVSGDSYSDGITAYNGEVYLGI
ncbi:MAG: hypothetical protein KKB81_02545 [Candidatus Margulisbacteria bacterium]|nr:hypothetical protein [Candidatus Margulisiibacteriota bacterium]MBU1021069.1 hypothetical protein [Candidatus Margulisiibacteriota bacterium]MBU1729744.1 hypothetical protein [Candidatus Margulisiibacteriota bacterium]MBU1956009.1 hypothetical protein [Candidatus Margulisiibacteriota bacterium]